MNPSISAEAPAAVPVRWGWFVVGGLAAAAGVVAFLIGLADVGALEGAVRFWGVSSLGAGVLLGFLQGAGLSVGVHRALLPGPIPVGAHAAHWLWIGAALLVAGLVSVSVGMRSIRAPERPLSAAAGAALYGPLQRYRDLHWGTLGAYSAGILFSELVLVLLQTWLAGSRGSVQLAPLTALGIALAVACVLAFAGGFLGAARAGTLGVPESTLAFLWAGLPFPLFVLQVTLNPLSASRWAVRLREVVYLAELLGDPRPGIFLVYFILVLAVVLGMTSGFVATGSGKLDLRVGFELFVGRRHVDLLRPSLVLGAFLVLLFGIVPPLLLFFVLRSAEATAERTRIRELGMKDPLQAAAALHAWKARAQTPTAMMTALSVGGVGTGVMAMIIVLSVMSGFEADLKRKILGNSAHAVVLKYADPFADYADALSVVRKVPGVVGSSPFMLNEVMIAGDDGISGVELKGVDAKTVGEVSDLPKNLEGESQMDWLDHPERIVQKDLKKAPVSDDPLVAPNPEASTAVLPGIFLGRELAQGLRARVGDRVNVVSPLGGELGPHGPMPKSRPFRVAGIFYSGMFEYDSKFAYISLTEAQRFFGVPGVTGIELKAADVDDARRIAEGALSALHGYPFHAKDWGEMNHSLFSALALEKLVMGILLTIMVIVAAGLIVATVIMLVLEKRKEISVLKALGVPDAGIVKIFLSEGLQIGVLGGFLGLVSGLAWCVYIDRFALPLNPEVYYIPKLPVRVEPLQTVLSVVIAILITYLASIYPALKAAEVEPVEGLKAE